MEVRDHHTDSGYKGRPTQASKANCPCRPCYNPHDCGYSYGAGHRVVQMECLTRYLSGCPLPKPKPRHILRAARCRVCLRCKQTVPKEERGAAVREG